MSPPQPSSLHTLAWLMGARTLAKTFSGSWSPLLSGMQQARCARELAFPPQRLVITPTSQVGFQEVPAPHSGPRAPAVSLSSYCPQCLMMQLGLTACLSLSLSHFAMSLKGFSGNPSQVKTLPMKPSLGVCFRGNSSRDTSRPISLCKN